MARDIDEAFERMQGLNCWGAHWDVDTGFRLNFGEPHLEVDNPSIPRAGVPLHSRNTYRSAVVRGDWVFRIDDAYWRAAFPDIPPVTGSSPYRRIMMAEARLDGQTLVGATVDPRNGATRILFDTDTVLEIRRRSRTGDQPLWDLRTPEHNHLVVFGNGVYGLGHGQGVDSPVRPVAG